MTTKTTKAPSLQKHIAWLNEEPKEIRLNKDGSQYVPIHIVQADLLEMCQGRTSFEVLHIDISRKDWILGYGRLHYFEGRSQEWIFQDGMAAIPSTGNPRLDYPCLGSHILLNAAKKIGPRFGQNLNRDTEEGLVIDEDRELKVDKPGNKSIADDAIIAKFNSSDAATQSLLKNIYIFPDNA